MVVQWNSSVELQVHRSSSPNVNEDRSITVLEAGDHSMSSVSEAEYVVLSANTLNCAHTSEHKAKRIANIA